MPLGGFLLNQNVEGEIGQPPPSRPAAQPAAAIDNDVRPSKPPFPLRVPPNRFERPGGGGVTRIAIPKKGRVGRREGRGS